ncbi:hypothetical protein G5S35_27950 [Paraburkholderia tropica]|uniref:VOC family protein n=1 Tax=Paraburkholderia tropica TaxID=92647 RepID=UPI0016010A3B|nr:hypothetical protein G5S35_27950 [Paraburkholderia tropica]
MDRVHDRHKPFGLAAERLRRRIERQQRRARFRIRRSHAARFHERAIENGASVVMDGLKIEAMKSVVLSSPDGHEFELCMCHA